MQLRQKEPLKFYNNYQEVYTRPDGYFSSLAAEIVKRLEGKDDLRILDIGCGFGDFLAAFYNLLGNKAEYYGLTIAEHEAELIQRERPFIRITLGREQDLKSFFNSRSFDLIINFHTLSYIRQGEQKILTKEMTDLLQPNGIVYLGLIDNWIKVGRGISQAGDGFVQFYYSPTIFLTLSRYCKLISSEIRRGDNYRLQLWQKQLKSSAPWRGGLLYAKYIIRNNLLFLGYCQKLSRKLRA